MLARDRETADGNQDTTSSTVGRSLTSTETVVTNSVSSSNHDQNRVIQNFSLHFDGYQLTNPGTSTCPKRSEPKSLPPVKRSRPSWGGYYKVQETWMQEFLCMAKKDVEVVPTKADTSTLLAAGLGCKKLTFGNRDDAPTFKRKMEDAYPKLKLGGGFDLLRSGVRPGELLLIKGTISPTAHVQDQAILFESVMQTISKSSENPCKRFNLCKSSTSLNRVRKFQSRICL